MPLVTRLAVTRARCAVLAASTIALLSGCFAGTPTADGGDGRVRLAMLQPPRSGLSPLSDDAFKLSRWSTAETLVRLDADGAAEPGLATSWRQVGERRWHLELRPGVTFHDGTTLTAADAVRSLEAATTASPKPRILDGVELTVTATGPLALTVETGDVDPLLPQRLSSPQLAVLAAAAYGPGGVVDPVGTGTGPFELTRVEGTSSAHLDRFDGYWGEPAAAAGIDADFVPDGAARAAALRTGTADLVEAVPVAQAPLLDDALLHEVPMPRTNTLYLNSESGPFADRRVRRIAAAAVDRARIVATVYEGRADIAAGLLGPAVPWAAGLRGSPLTPPAGRVDGVRITLGTFTDRAELPEVAVALQQQLEAVGFRVTQDVREYAQIEQDALAGRFDGFILSRATELDSGDPVAYLTSDFTCDGSFNLAQLCDPAVDRLVRTASETAPGPRRQRAVIAAERAVLATYAAVPMLHERVLQGEAADLAGARRDPRERELVGAATALDR